ncbi:hypothetical protein [Streptomyces ambofaciens]|uniref:Uncharacterized protein n=1 Tax=Streptomyces ambofaciens (strain ATCC 23877 / 3486 / DSM 40053 / JCM 4204 / NBRC 12836 / NRRL B-2516) TaxID=278992 RepID=A3KHU5_STRA7|nr:hypothetical protein [Streptomyces ambofaciens]CAJ89271.1 hypothetical protein SAML0284 [Streptomyces ambofaciens ATCC 23877]
MSKPKAAASKDAGEPKVDRMADDVSQARGAGHIGPPGSHD